MPTTAATQDWRAIARAKRAALAHLIPPPLRLATTPDPHLLPSAIDHVNSCGLLSAEELRLTATTADARALRDGLAAGTLSSAALTAAVVKRAAVLQQLTGCCSELCFEAAEARAAWLDGYLAETGRVVGPLHGLPVSVKDGFEVAGVDTTVGMFDFSSIQFRRAVLFFFFFLGDFCVTTRSRMGGAGWEAGGCEWDGGGGFAGAWGGGVLQDQCSAGAHGMLAVFFPSVSSQASPLIPRDFLCRLEV